MDNGHRDNTFLVAAASTDCGYTVDVHFGRAGEFYIYRFAEGEWDYVEKRSVKPVCRGGSHSAPEMEQRISLFQDCRYVIASRIGIAAITPMSRKGITAMALPGDLIEALKKIQTYDEIQSLF